MPHISIQKIWTKQKLANSYFHQSNNEENKCRVRLSSCRGQLRVGFKCALNNFQLTTTANGNWVLSKRVSLKKQTPLNGRLYTQQQTASRKGFNSISGGSCLKISCQDSSSSSFSSSFCSWPPFLLIAGSNVLAFYHIVFYLLLYLLYYSPSETWLFSTERQKWVDLQGRGGSE